jgi:RHS repeat-associated protein
VYDRRLSKSIDADGAGSGAATVQRFVYYGHHIVMEFDGNNAGDLTHRYLHGPVIDQILADEEVTSLNQAGTMRWPLADNLGTVRDLVDSSATVLNHLKYDAYGKVTSESNAAVDFLFAFTGRERDEETGLQFNRARYYDPAVGRWISEDPIGFAAGDGNLVRFARNSPSVAANSTNSPVAITPKEIDSRINSAAARFTSVGMWIARSRRKGGPIAFPIISLNDGTHPNVNLPLNPGPETPYPNSTPPTIDELSATSKQQTTNFNTQRRLLPPMPVAAELNATESTRRPRPSFSAT